MVHLLSHIFWTVKRIYLILFLSFSELFPAFNWAKVSGNQLSIWFGVNVFKPFPCLFLFCSADSSLSNSGISVVSDCSPVFLSLGFIISFNSDKIYAIFSSFVVNGCLVSNFFTSSTISLYFSINSCTFIFLLFMSFNKLSALSGVISFPYILTFNPLF